ncbi:hypothetical protein GH714_001685 [Hevea brasiliensis]|uniref:Rx N-terminal domain-containing protein n=1 Tax=Hevea brasiliensis TaxID=3981 RepID=A0A6A6LHR2_HEVBR|nr:hypothetical protein GH714_001685 [Hevea brasiliensis]
MALELVAGAFLTTVFDHLVQKMGSPVVVDFFRGHNLDEGLLNKLKISMITVSGLLDHAEEKQISVPAVKKWVDELKHSAYEADDLLDEIAYQDLQSKLEAGSPKQKVRKFLSSKSFEKKVNEKLLDIFEQIEHLLKQMQALGLTIREGIGEKPSLHKIPTTSLLPDDDESSVYGRQFEKENIKNLMQSTDDKDLGAICIVGIGGLGKTTFARLVYNDSRVKEMFQLRAWVFVSEEFDVSKMTRDILRQDPEVSCGDGEALQSLQDKLQEKLKEKSFYLSWMTFGVRGLFIGKLY